MLDKLQEKRLSKTPHLIDNSHVISVPRFLLDGERKTALVDVAALDHLVQIFTCLRVAKLAR